jgi:hypothetical protein
MLKVKQMNLVLKEKRDEHYFSLICASAMHDFHSFSLSLKSLTFAHSLSKLFSIFVC